MISGSKGQKVVRACTIRLLNLGPAKYEKVAIYAVNQRISHVCRVLCAGDTRLAPIVVERRCGSCVAAEQFVDINKFWQCVYINWWKNLDKL